MRLLSKMFSFQGRDNRADFLAYIGLSILFVMVGAVGVVGVSSITSPGSLEPDASPPVFAVALLGVLILAILVIRFLSTARRFRDLESSPWLALLIFVPVINFIVLVALMFIPGKGVTPEDAARVF